jgi:DNA-binding transcriptional regulator YiaG
MTPEQFRKSLAKLGETQVSFARLVGCDARTVRRWAAGERSIPGGVKLALRLMLLAESGRLISSTKSGGRHGRDQGT